MSYNRRNNLNTFIASFVLVVLIAAFAVVGFFIFDSEPAKEEDRYPWIVSDIAAADGMLDGTFYDGEKNSAGVLSYKIAESITVGGDGRGDRKLRQKHLSDESKDTC